MNILDYINNIGSKSLEEVPFNKVDSLVLCALSYLKFDKHVPKIEGGLQGVLLSDIASSDDVDLLFRDERNRAVNEELLRAVVASNRYGKIRLRDFYDIINTGMAVQFCAMTVLFENGLTYVLYRGTDDNLVGWKEDFNMMFKGPVPAQKMAKVYLETQAERIKGGFYVGGHSKGGNLAIYSSSMLAPSVQDRIIKVISHDSPGFTEDFFRSSNYENIKDKIDKQVPKSSVFGLWLFTPDKYEIILSEGEGRAQHNPFNWIIDEEKYNDFVYVNELDEAYVLKQEIFNEWVKESNPEKALAAIDLIFTLIDNSGINNMNDLNERDKVISAARKFIHGYKEADEAAKKKVSELLNLYFEITAREKVKIRENKYIELKHNIKDELDLAKDFAKDEVKRIKTGHLGKKE